MEETEEEVKRHRERQTDIGRESDRNTDRHGGI